MVVVAAGEPGGALDGVYCAKAVQLIKTKLTRVIVSAAKMDRQLLIAASSIEERRPTAA